MTRRRRHYTHSELFDDPSPGPDATIGDLRQALAETFAELEQLRDEAAHNFARAEELEQRLTRHNRRAGEDAI